MTENRCLEKGLVFMNYKRFMKGIVCSITIFRSTASRAAKPVEVGKAKIVVVF